MAEMWKLHTEERPRGGEGGTTRCPLIPSSCSWGGCQEQGVGKATLPTGATASGNWRSGELEGPGNITRPDGSVVRGYFQHGCLEGRVTLQEIDGALIVAGYSGGVVVSGPLWLLLPQGEGALYTRVQAGYAHITRALFTGDSVAFLYPDLTTSLRGDFVAGTMLAAVEAVVRGHRVTSQGIPEIYFTDSLTDSLTSSTDSLTASTSSTSSTSSLPSGAVFTSDPSTEHHLSSSPLLRDPYEAKVVRVATSTIPGAGVGVFSLLPVPRGRIVGFFNGVHRHRQDIFSGEKSAYLVEGGHPNELLDIPPDFRSWASYMATSGHLINHAEDGNVDYTDCWHPRFGRILCVEAVRDIPAGSELFVKYDVTVDSEGFKNALKTALGLGHLFSGKSKQEFSRDVKPYLKIAADVMKTFNRQNLIKFP